MLLPSFRRNKSFYSLSGRPIHHLFWARNAIYHGLSALGLNPGDNVLVPAFHCTSVVEPILQYGAEVKFYDVNLDVSPDFDDLRSKIDGKTRAILAIHYFGFPQPIEKFRTLCQERKLYLIEDCAHVLTGRTRERIRLGDSGDISVFSWRKFLPVYDGGQLAINNPNLQLNLRLDQGNFLFKLKIIKNTFERLFEGSRGSRINYVSALWNLRSFVSKRLARVHTSSARVYQVNNYDLEFDLSNASLAMSGISKRILDRTIITDVAEKRHHNYARLERAVRSMRGLTPLYPNLPETVCPWIFPFLVHGTKDFQLLLRRRGIPATSWSGVIHPSLPLPQFPKARVLYDHLNFLPVHQTLSERDLETMIRVLRETLNESVEVNAKGFDDCFPLSALSRR